MAGGRRPQSPVVKLVNYLLYSGGAGPRFGYPHRSRTTTISRVRYRVDGRLITRSSIRPTRCTRPSSARIKIMSKHGHLRTTRSRRTATSTSMHRWPARRSPRVSTMPGKFGEKVVTRVIDNRNAIIPAGEAWVLEAGDARGTGAEASSTRRTAWCSSPVPRARASPPRCTRC